MAASRHEDPVRASTILNVRAAVDSTLANRSAVVLTAFRHADSMNK
jgi:hypothetical protein